MSPIFDATDEPIRGVRVDVGGEITIVCENDKGAPEKRLNRMAALSGTYTPEQVRTIARSLGCSLYARVGGDDHLVAPDNSTVSGLTMMDTGQDWLLYRRKRK
ncbi:hypothetical protein HOA55_00575 [archaeon]|jgi:hypothetical protein|nr:hypothetical protein [archaeon]MBT3578248.1 hypothetical protein [archaeon]MBT6819831.1 hypothetical protein [archaeon]MBT6956593.1 hypothetical protein [archaeon]MBT7025613.1 hypothetical protein [archaeon]